MGHFGTESRAAAVGREEDVGERARVALQSDYGNWEADRCNALVIKHLLVLPELSGRL